MNPSEFWWPVRQLLERHLTHLRGQLEILGERLRDALAGTVGKAVADAVREVVQRLLEQPHASANVRDRRFHDPWEREERDPWDERDDAEWQRDSWRPDPDDGYDAEHDEPAISQSTMPAATHWLRSVGVGLQAAAWLLRRKVTGLPLASALGLGLVASVTAFVSCPTIITMGAGVVAAVLGLLNLIENAASAAGRTF